MSNHYIMIFEDQTVKHATKVTNEDMQSVEAGILDVINITDPETPLQLNGIDGDWLPMESVEDESSDDDSDAD